MSRTGPTWGRAAASALPLWVGSRVAIVLMTLGAGWLLPTGGGRPHFLDQWHHWDADLFRKVAQYGYFAPQYQDRTEAFFPGMPLAMRFAHVLVPDWIGAGLLVAAVAGAVACVALYQLGALEAGDEVGRRAVVYLVVFPYAVFLFAGYSEALFLAFATTAWLAARRDAWVLAGVLGAGASLTRITGVALAAGLAVELLTRRGWRSVLSTDVLAAVLPALPVVGYFAYLRSHTGHWDAYARALEEGWGRSTVSPVKALQTTWDAAHNTMQSRAFQWSWRAELLAMAVGVVVTVVLLVSKRWGEATFVGLNVALLSTSSYYASCVRALLVWFPAFLLLARVSVRWKWVHPVVLTVFAPLSALTVVAFTVGSWLG